MVTWKPAKYFRMNQPPGFATIPESFMLLCPYCNEEWGVYQRGVHSRMPDEIVCSECEKTFVVPVHVSRGKL